MIINFAFRFLIWAAFILIVVAQEDTDFELDDATPSASAKAAQTITVKVGNGNNQFDPDKIVAGVGDIIQFEFFPPNHSVARAEAGRPCIPYEQTGRNINGFFSGFRPLNEVPENPSTYNLRINDTYPVFFYCSAPKSCIDYAMVGVINPNASYSLIQQQDAARKSPYMRSPGEPFASQEDGSSPGTPSPSTPTAPGTPTPSAARGKRLSSGAIAGIAIGGVIGGGLISALLLVLCRKSRNFSQRRKESMVNPPSHSGYESGTPQAYSSLPMSDREPYTSWSPYGLPMPQSPPAELSSPQPDLNKHASVVSGETAYDDARWQTITPPRTHQPAIPLELDASPPPQGLMILDTPGYRENQR